MIGSIISAGANLIGGALNRRHEKSMAENNANLQRDFAQMGIQWKVQDAKAAGLHPLAALGAQTITPSPSYVSGGSFGNSVAAAGQDIGRAVSASMDTQGREMRQMQIASAKLDLEGKHIDNQIRASQLAKMQQVGPPMPSAATSSIIPGQDPRITDNPLERVISAAHAASQEPGPVTEIGYLQTPSGQFPVKSRDATERLEDDIFGNIMWNIRNRLFPNFGFNQNPPSGSTDTWYNPALQQYQRDPRAGLFSRAFMGYARRAHKNSRYRKFYRRMQ